MQSLAGHSEAHNPPTLEELQALDKRLDAILREHQGHDTRYVHGCRACIHRAAFNYQLGIDDTEARLFLSQIGTEMREAAIKEVNEVMGDAEFYVEPIKGEVAA
jgi:hypothetical protein